jgi:SAM-dependent methyltransferase
MAAADRFVDRLATDASYRGEAALAYDAWMPPGTRFPDDGVHRQVIRRCGGTALELGTGNGRFLIPAREDGLDVEGIDASPEMLAVCRRHAAERRLDVVLHEGDMAPLALDRRFHAIVCPAGSFTLITDVERATDALRSYHDHLEPGGEVAITMFTPTPDDSTGFMWRLRRTGTDARTGITYVVDEAVGPDRAPQTMLTYNRAETYDDSGRLLHTVMRKIRIRWWHQEELTDALVRAGFGDVEVLGDEHGWVTTARRP